ncbi:MAG: hypothetical protein M3Q30_18055 [Actinomycetota bacterium]|nr:hypothetical protein [Actinomycetota bacterium]
MATNIAPATLATTPAHVGQPYQVSNGVFKYTASNGTTFTFYSDATTPRVNGFAISYAPTYLFNSPYMKSLWLSGKVTITKGSSSATYDFSDTAHPVKVAS